MDIEIQSIPHGNQRYETVGDWWLTNQKKSLHVRVSEMQREEYEFLVAIHECIEAFFCKLRGVEEEKVTDFDVKFEALRAMAPDLVGEQEPGDMICAPYYREHQFATRIEKIICAELGIDWDDYNSAVEGL